MRAPPIRFRQSPISSNRRRPSGLRAVAGRSALFAFAWVAVLLATSCSGRSLARLPGSYRPAPAVSTDPADPPAGGSAPTPFAVFDTSEGRFVCRLLPEYAPETVRNFIGLVDGSKPWVDPVSGQSVSRPFYDGLQFHRVIPGFLIQAGCPSNNGLGDPGYHIRDEISPELHHNRPGILGMATVWGRPDSGGSQFYITLAPAPHLDGKCPIFGYVFEGMDVVERIGKTPVDDRWRPVVPVVLRHVRIVEM